MEAIPTDNNLPSRYHMFSHAPNGHTVKSAMLTVRPAEASHGIYFTDQLTSLAFYGTGKLIYDSDSIVGNLFIHSFTTDSPRRHSHTMVM